MPLTLYVLAALFYSLVFSMAEFSSQADGFPEAAEVTPLFAHRQRQLPAAALIFWLLTDHHISA